MFLRRLLVGILAAFVYIGAAFAAVNVNTASQAELEALNGIGPAKARAILDYRQKNGPFKSVDDLKKVNGIGDKTLESIRKDVSLSGATTLPAAKPGAKPAAPAPASAKAAPAAKPASAPAAAPAADKATTDKAKKPATKKPAPAGEPAVDKDKTAAKDKAKKPATAPAQ
ncbi:ComEA family DNA-binding protein [Microvirgula aerodenitrificans]|uniref:ComEA family DNA-binding protein n=1 Tax=Microvirgula aerodenitrificans TaxID=57480 RepID=UPI0018FFFD9C|nr:ComEA family DNA-binding protein [Microvirgula aerodenitrificans]